MPEVVEVSTCEVAMTTEVRTMPCDARGSVSTEVTAKMTGAEVATAKVTATEVTTAAAMAAASPGKSISRNRNTAERENRNQRKD
jgi:hypothetical protein